MKNAIIYFVVLILSISVAYSAEDFTEAKKLIDAKTTCSSLTEGQLEDIGDYLMEQIHPGQAHEFMDNMMGGEGSESLRLMHIAMAKRLYCNDFTDSVNYGMMGGSLGYGMMGSYGYWGFWNFLSAVLAIGLIVLVYLWVIKLWREVFNKKK